MAENGDQYTQDNVGARGEQQDLVQERDAKAEVLAEAVNDRELFERRSALIILAAATCLFVLTCSALAYGLREVSQVADRSEKVICGLRQGYQQQLRQTKVFLEKNPDGGVLLGVQFTAASMRAQIATIKLRLKDTEDAKC